MRPRGGAGKPHRWCAISPKTLAQSWCVRNARKASEVFRALTYARSHSSDHHVHILVPRTAQGGTSVLSPIRGLHFWEWSVRYCPTLLPHPMLVFMSPPLWGAQIVSSQHTSPWEALNCSFGVTFFRLCPSLLLGRCVSFPNKPVGRNQTWARPCLVLSFPRKDSGMFVYTKFTASFNVRLQVASDKRNTNCVAPERLRI